MNSETKRCPYCGEEILAVAKKCKHCKTWLDAPAAPPVQPVQPSQPYATMQSPQPVQQRPQYAQPMPRYYEEEKETDFPAESHYDKAWMKILFWVTIIGSAIGAVHTSGLADELGGRRFGGGKYINALKLLCRIPEWVGDLLSIGGTIIFFVLLMNVFSSLRKPLQGCFIASIVLAALSFFLGIWGDEDEIAILLVLVGTGFLAMHVVLGILMIVNYEGSIRTLGIVFIVYIVASIVVFCINEFVYSPYFMSMLILGVDAAFYYYLCEKLSGVEVKTESNDEI